MPKSRGRKPKRSSKQRRSSTRPNVEWIRQQWEHAGPYARAMTEADAAEARGDAAGALTVMDALPFGPDGKVFWRPWRVRYLMQLVMLGPLLPRWATSRWILNQAMQHLSQATRTAHLHALDLAYELARGAGDLDGVDELDAKTRIMDHDWVFRQLFLYDLGGLEHFLRHGASPDLVVGADSIHEWVRAPLGGFRLVGSDAGRVTWHDLATDELRTVPNLGSAIVLGAGAHVIGRLVSTEDGALFESLPLAVPAYVAHRVAVDPAGWLAALREARGRGEDIVTSSGPFDLVGEVTLPLWQLVLGPVESASEEEHGGAVARHVLRLAGETLGRGVSRADGGVDVWPCLTVALVEPWVLESLADVVGVQDLPTLHALAELLPEPAAGVCREMAERLDQAA